MRRALLTLSRVVDRLAGRSIFESASYREAELARLLNLFAFIDLDDWRGHRLLEVGAGLGHMGGAFADLGFDVTFSDGRPEHVERMRRDGRKALILDLDTADLGEAGEWDVVLAFGVLYHLEEPERFLRSAARAARILVLESCVADLLEAELLRVPERRGPWGADQALGGTGCRPSPAWVERTCREAGFDSVRDISSPVGNWSIGRFDWQPRGTGEWRREGVNLRKMWLMERSATDGGRP